ncbi:hypothetical protein ACIQXV_08065 [Neobacillus sp. NPDC097160]|uniref:hypothetical protein n=1 Tax=Neobacillus sp. NPDC097160 TaxID=3364298 RepID=UPI0037F97734
MEHLKNGSMGIKYDEVRHVQPVIVSGKRFDSIEGKAFINGRRDIVRTQYYWILLKGYQLSIITTCISEDGSEDLRKIVHNLKME